MKTPARLLLLAALLLPLVLGAAPPGEEVPDSSHLQRLDASPPAQASPGPEPVRVLWDFGKAGETVYRFCHDAATSGEANGLRSPRGETLTRGTLTLRTKGEGTGDLVLAPEEVTVRADGRTLRTEGPSEPTTVAGLSEDGRTAGVRSDRQALLALLFPLAPEELRTGESSERPVQFPLSVGPLRVTVQGTATTTMTGWAQVDGKACARLQTEVSLTRVLTPPGTLGSLHAAGRGRSVFYWDPAARGFERGSMALRLVGRYGYDRPNPIEGFPALRLSATGDLDQFAEIVREAEPARP